MLSTKKIFMLKAFVLALRPFCVMLDQFYFGEQGKLPLIISIGSMIFLSTSIPLHIDHYKKDLKSDYEKKVYINGVVTLILYVSLVCMALIGILFGLKIGVAIAAFYVIDKICDELAREYEYRREYFWWMGMQVYKSIWMLLVILFGERYFDYLGGFSVIGVIGSLAIFKFFCGKSRIAPKIDINSLYVILKKIKFLLGGVISGGYQQIPRIVISNNIPEKAHLVTLIAQAFQLVNILYDAKYFSTHRRAMSIRTELFYSKFNKKSSKIILGMVGAFSLLATARWIISNFSSMHEFDDVFISIFVAFDGFIFLYISIYLGYLQWVEGRINVSIIYLALISIYASLTGLLAIFFKYDNVSLVYIVNSICGVLIFWVLTSSLIKIGKLHET